MRKILGNFAEKRTFYCLFAVLEPRFEVTNSASHSWRALKTAAIFGEFCPVKLSFPKAILGFTERLWSDSQIVSTILEVLLEIAGKPGILITVYKQVKCPQKG